MYGRPLFQVYPPHCYMFLRASPMPKSDYVNYYHWPACFCVQVETYGKVREHMVTHCESNTVGRQMSR